jgi:hypothetical protein
MPLEIFTASEGLPIEEFRKAFAPSFTYLFEYGVVDKEVRITGRKHSFLSGKNLKIDKHINLAYIFSPKLDIAQNNSLRVATPSYVIIKFTNLGKGDRYG